MYTVSPNVDTFLCRQTSTSDIRFRHSSGIAAMPAILYLIWTDEGGPGVPITDVCHRLLIPVLWTSDEAINIVRPTGVH
jgi:hypothetical protein